MFAIPCWGSFLAPTLLVPLGLLNYEIRWFDGGFYALFRMPGTGSGILGTRAGILGTGSQALRVPESDTRLSPFIVWRVGPGLLVRILRNFCFSDT
uniref:Uncharacterized protein n=1 Tax=Candidatus Kentrum sp. LPFa TaxID=2126335 RepID=A0A450W0A4_9GAMM|nr:MAG: hypothetical protein BECKLPF1236A_GA0070988_100391 [Candidatus Kentron sp. LPFa]VFK26820.1 MAG: hypothetical protein BECKLPF1236C_GA0070990_100391 [Candidatus Kentron sp. LPFa]